MDLGISWRIDSWYTPRRNCEKPCRISFSGLLVIKTRSWTVCNVPALAKSWKTRQLSPCLSHSCKASITRTKVVWTGSIAKFEIGSITSCFHWSSRILLAIPSSSSSDTALFICSPRTGNLASCIAILVTNLSALLTSSSPLEKKKLAKKFSPRRPLSKYSREIVWAMIDFPVPAQPLNQKIFNRSCPSIHALIWFRISTRVLGRQMSSLFPEALNAALVA